jgi:hypothetical protein
MRDEELVEDKRQKAASQAAPKLVKRDPINTCPICDVKDPSREHISRHFMNELLDHVATLPNSQVWKSQLK